jgi:hypothetical protein
VIRDFRPAVGSQDGIGDVGGNNRVGPSHHLVIVRDFFSHRLLLARPAPGQLHGLGLLALLSSSGALVMHYFGDLLAGLPVSQRLDIGFVVSKVRKVWFSCRFTSNLLRYWLSLRGSSLRNAPPIGCVALGSILCLRDLVDALLSRLLALLRLGVVPLLNLLGLRGLRFLYLRLLGLGFLYFGFLHFFSHGILHGEFWFF